MIRLLLSLDSSGDSFRLKELVSYTSKQREADFDLLQLHQSSSSDYIQPPSNCGSTTALSVTSALTMLSAIFSAPFLFFVCGEISTITFALSLPNFYPFGEDVGDHVNPPNDDGGSGEVQISIPFPFFGEVHNSLFVSNIK